MVVRLPTREPSHGRQYCPGARPTQAALGNLSREGGTTRERSAASPHRSSSDRWTRMVSDRHRAVLFERHHLTLAEALRRPRRRWSPGGNTGPPFPPDRLDFVAGGLGQGPHPPRLRLLPQSLVLLHLGPAAL